MKQATVCHSIQSRDLYTEIHFCNGKLNYVKTRDPDGSVRDVGRYELEKIHDIYEEAKEIEAQGLKIEVPEGYTTEPLPSRFENDAEAS